MGELKDCGDILLIDDENTYALIDAMLAALADSFINAFHRQWLSENKSPCLNV